MAPTTQPRDTPVLNRPAAPAESDDFGGWKVVAMGITELDDAAV
jgi:hypothetical protein